METKALPLPYLLSNIFWFYQISVLILWNIFFCCIKHLFVVSNIFYLYNGIFQLYQTSLFVDLLHVTLICEGSLFCPQKACTA